jgi:hypothetical protein
MFDVNLKRRHLRQELISLPIHIFIAMPGGLIVAFALNSLVFRPHPSVVGHVCGAYPSGYIQPCFMGSEYPIGVRRK